MLRVVERDHGRGQQQEALIEAIAATLSGPTPWRAVPGAIHDVLGGRGWEWNGI